MLPSRDRFPSHRARRRRDEASPQLGSTAAVSSSRRSRHRRPLRRPTIRVPWLGLVQDPAHAPVDDVSSGRAHCHTGVRLYSALLALGIRKPQAQLPFPVCPVPRQNVSASYCCHCNIASQHACPLLIFQAFQLADLHTYSPHVLLPAAFNTCLPHWFGEETTTLHVSMD